MGNAVDLGEDLECFVAGLLRDGVYGSRDEALREGARLLRERQARLAEFDAAMMRGIEDAEAGRSEDAEIVFARLRRRYEDMAAKTAA